MRLLLGSGGIGTPDRKQAWIDQWNDFLGPITKVLFIAWAVDDAARKEWQEAVNNAHSRIQEKLVPPEIFAEVRKLRSEFREKESSRP